MAHPGSLDNQMALGSWRFKVTAAREEGYKISICTGSASPGDQARSRLHAGPRRAARTRGARGGRRAGGGGAGLPRGADGRQERRRVDAGGSPPDRQTGADRRPGCRARKQHKLRRPGAERGGWRSHRSIYTRPGRCWSKGASRPGRSLARPLRPGARGGAATRERPGAAALCYSDPWRAEDRSAAEGVAVQTQEPLAVPMVLQTARLPRVKPIDNLTHPYA
ncbi:uncharacterized protein LOC119056708 [Artibeus jamaicensis]|uniref:uncharacterized protein LOC119056708 n=1 Tax=Artibeus jamaicensis TaxID=9417 RepID=UPI00235A487C|nr:uncharacterized protein LOC119056708 [Artibeus jamaicensis]